MACRRAEDSARADVGFADRRQVVARQFTVRVAEQAARLPEACAFEGVADAARVRELWLLQAPGFEAVLEWRIGQERKLRERLAAAGQQGTRAMSDDEVARFIANYERLTRHILAEMPARADVLIPVERAR